MNAGDGWRRIIIGAERASGLTEDPGQKSRSPVRHEIVHRRAPVKTSRRQERDCLRCCCFSGLSGRKSGDECGSLPNCSRERPVARTPPRASDAILAPGFAEDHVGRRRDRGRSARRGARAGAPRDPRENPTRFILSVTSRARRVLSSSRASLTAPPPPRLASPRRLALPPSALAHALSAPPSPSRIRASSRSTSSTRASPRTRRTTRITPSAASSSTSRVPRSSR